MEPEIKKIAQKFRNRCRSLQDWECLQQDVYVIYLEHKHKYDRSKSSLNTWCHNYLFKKVLTFVDSAAQRNSKRYVPMDNLPVIKTYQMNPDLRKLIKNLTKDEIYAINKYDPKLVHHRRGPFAKNIARIKEKLEDI